MGCLFLSFVETLEEIWFCRFFHVLHVQVCENMAHLLVPAVRFFELSRALEKKKKRRKKDQQKLQNFPPNRARNQRTWFHEWVLTVWWTLNHVHHAFVWLADRRVLHDLQVWPTNTVFFFPLSRVASSCESGWPKQLGSSHATQIKPVFHPTETSFE